jgi:hypothetical protein
LVASQTSRVIAGAHRRALVRAPSIIFSTLAGIVLVAQDEIDHLDPGVVLPVAAKARLPARSW